MKNLLPLWMHGLKQWVMSMLIKTWRTALPLSISLSTQQSLGSTSQPSQHSDNSDERSSLIGWFSEAG